MSKTKADLTRRFFIIRKEGNLIIRPSFMYSVKDSIAKFNSREKAEIFIKELESKN